MKHQELSKEQQIMVETILLEADAWGLRYEVDRDAKRYMQERNDLDVIDAYVWAYEDWIK